jgi:hypothetical protein
VQFHELYEELIGDEQRNRLICQDVIQALREGRSPLVLTERNEHLESLATQLAHAVTHLVVLRGGMLRKDLDAISPSLAAIPAGESRVLLATGRFVGEGFDDARLDTLFLTLPVSWHGTIAQYVGRLYLFMPKSSFALNPGKLSTDRTVLNAFNSSGCNRYFSPCTQSLRTTAVVCRPSEGCK